jgi:DNA processing protein
MDDTCRAYIQLQASGLSLGKQTAVVKAFGAAPAALAASASEVRDRCPQFRPSDIDALAAASAIDVSPAVARLEALGANVVGYGMPGYPRLLAQIEDSPPILYVRGEFTKADELCVAIVGTRRSTPYGESATEKLAAGLGRRGFTIVSGLAVGIDAAAHRACLQAGTRTIGVMACGIDIDYPKSNTDLREGIPACGAVISEMPLGQSPLREIFPQRNRIVSGLSLGVIVVEAPAKSGALITANLALDQGREVFAVPGDISSANARGCHALIKDGARLTETVEDVIDGLGIMLQAVPERRPAEQVKADLSPDEHSIVDELAAGPRQLDQLVVASGLPAARVSAALMLLEVKQVIKRMSGGTYARIA